MLNLKSPIGTNYRVDPNDLMDTKRALSDLGYYDVPPHRGIDDWSDDATFNGIKRFQQDNGLKVDGFNLRCSHCYLDEKVRPGPGIKARRCILDKLERAGCLWLQPTGGEALADPLFEQTYRAAWERGFLLTISTNGQLIGRWIELFREMPPLRLTVSLYGASGTSYAATTGNRQAFQDVIDGLDAARRGWDHRARQHNRD